MTDEFAASAASQFRLEGAIQVCEPYGHGHINETYRVVTDRDRWYILQKINRHVFGDVQALMRNIAAVTRHLGQTETDPRRVLTLIAPRQGGLFYTDERADCWRVYAFVRDSLSLDRPETAGDFQSSGEAFGTFQRQLSDFPAETLTETIPRFHDTPHRYAQLRQAIEADALDRLREVGPEIAFVMQREEEAGAMVAMGHSGELPLRVTHNDTKLNNVMLDAQTRAPLCVIDLDTVMPGLSGNDFGDSIRFGASTAAEDETDLDRVSLSLKLYAAYARGFLGACGDSLTASEIETLPLGAKLMTLECGIRFLADYLNGDVYFRIAHPTHNLDRCRTQFKLVADMETKWAQMHRLLAEAR